jgi:hypothetical protein
MGGRRRGSPSYFRRSVFDGALVAGMHANFLTQYFIYLHLYMNNNHLRAPTAGTSS